MTEDFYDLLEIPSDASQDEIKDAYREQVRVYHPDLNDDDRAQAQFTAVKTAYDILGDPVERQAYDRLGHEEYVAKRTSGLPSPDVWTSDDGGDEEADDTELRYSEAETQSTSSATASSATAGSATAGSRTTGRSSTTASAGTGSTAGTASAGTTSKSSSTTGTGTRNGTATAGGGDTEAARDTDRSGETSTQPGSRAETVIGNPVTRWWRRQNFSLPLLWLSLLIYVAGLAHVAVANESPLGSLWADLRATGADPAGIWSLLSESRHGLETSIAFVQRVEVVTPPLEPTLWNATLAGVVALALGTLLVMRVVRRETTWSAVTIDETIIVALALGTTTMLVGGPLLAGAVLMPLLFSVIVRHTRRLPGWTPSYLYVVPVLAPAAGFIATAAGVASLPVDLAAFVLVPLLGGLALPVRATVLKYIGR
ncbi:J domain-containing protein [Haloterrigena sp. H1]|uniref:J domain-containing protein n=1 Tax=Haloterrigena sp. H1 TaxID=2552943 RepID=UPI00110DDF6D|nr:DnaJ domain-containing protein [Haloterrigena sp. H1]TMT86555.1 J domain-containing protein [Haloterrigena sp. H1]